MEMGQEDRNSDFEHKKFKRDDRSYDLLSASGKEFIWNSHYSSQNKVKANPFVCK